MQTTASAGIERGGQESPQASAASSRASTREEGGDAGGEQERCRDQRPDPLAVAGAGREPAGWLDGEAGEAPGKDDVQSEDEQLESERQRGHGLRRSPREGSSPGWWARPARRGSGRRSRPGGGWKPVEQLADRRAVRRNPPVRGDVAERRQHEAPLRAGADGGGAAPLRTVLVAEQQQVDVERARRFGDRAGVAIAAEVELDLLGELEELLGGEVRPRRAPRY